MFQLGKLYLLRRSWANSGILSSLAQPAREHSSRVCLAQWPQPRGRWRHELRPGCFDSFSGEKLNPQGGVGFKGGFAYPVKFNSHIQYSDLEYDRSSQLLHLEMFNERFSGLECSNVLRFQLRECLRGGWWSKWGGGVLRLPKDA